jgi:hypothetical protein
METINLSLGDQDYTIELTNNATNRALLPLLPLEIKVGEYGGHHYYGPAHRPLPASVPVTSSP